MKDNKIIAEFMELETETFSSGIVNYYHQDIAEGSFFEEHELSYNVSWDWLMPVCQKIDEYLEDNIGNAGHFDDCLSCNDIDAKYKAVVNFINELNN